MPQGQGSWGLALAISALAELSLGGPSLPVWQTCSQRARPSWLWLLGAQPPPRALLQVLVPVPTVAGLGAGVERAQPVSPGGGGDLAHCVGRTKCPGQDSSTPGDGEWPLAGHLCWDRCCPLPTPTERSLQETGCRRPPRAWSMRWGKVLDFRSAQRSGVEKAVLALPLWLSQSCCPRPQPSQD